MTVTREVVAERLQKEAGDLPLIVAFGQWTRKQGKPPRGKATWGSRIGEITPLDLRGRLRLRLALCPKERDEFGGA